MVSYKTILSIATPIIAGVSGYFIGRQKSRKSEEQARLNNEKLNETIEFYCELNESLGKENERFTFTIAEYQKRYGKLDDDPLGTDVPDEVPDIPKYGGSKISYGSITRPKPALGTLVKQYNRAVRPEDEDIPPTEDRPGEPYEISESEVDQSEYELIQVEYYPEDRILADDRNSKIGDPVRVTGQAVWEKLPVTQDMSVFVKHESRFVIYEILINRGLSYVRDVLGEDG